MVFVSGTSGIREDNSIASTNESYEQARRAIGKIEAILKKANCSLEDVVLTRVFLSHDADWRGVARAHAEFFGKILPSSSMLVCQFLDPRILVEIEAQAVVE